jgi:hypothetical protein
LFATVQIESGGFAKFADFDGTIFSRQHGSLILD